MIKIKIVSKQYKFKSASGLCDIYAKSFVPDTDVKAVVQISHGMAEHCARYERFAAALCENGYAVFMSDHVGHGQSVCDKQMLGFFGDTDGENSWTKDLKTVLSFIKSEFPTLPVFIFGHGMGSLIARKYTLENPNTFKGAVYTGTNGSNPAVDFGILLCNIAIALKGSRYKSKLIDKIAFGAYNNKTSKKTPCDWASRDEAEVKSFIDDDLCGYMYTVSGLKALFKTVKAVTSKSWFSSIDKDLPIFLLSGSMDPVGNYAKGVYETYNNLIKTKHSNVSIKIYDGARHEILNETNRDEVTSDIISWLDNQL